MSTESSLPAAFLRQQTAGAGVQVHDGAEDESPHGTNTRRDLRMDASEANLYDIDTTGLKLKKLCGGGITSSMESCVAAVRLPGDEDAYMIGDTKLGAGTPTLRFTQAELRTFVDAFEAGAIG
jgi:hypothetical protein